MKPLIFLPVFLLSLAYSQGLLPGMITYQNSGNNPVPGALVKVGTTNRTETATDGTFSLAIPGKQAGYEVLLNIEKKGYEVVNKKELFTTLRADAVQRLKLYLCPTGEWERNALAYYQINEGPITKKYMDQVVRIRREMTSQEQLMVDSLAVLAVQYKIVLAQADELAEKFALANLDDVSDLYEEAFHLFVAGKIDKALASLNEQKLSALLTRIEQEKAQGKELIAIGEQKLLVAEQAIRQGIQNYVLKARLCVVAFRFDEADVNFRKAVRYDSLDFELNFEYGYFLQQQNRFRLATARYEKVLKLAKYPEHTALTLNNLGIALTDQNDYSRGLPAFEKALKI